ncbi:MAG: hypothetical protein WC376_00905 [Candidatus Nanoarchaeia archaeon]|jgi:hypothetical protein
MFDTNYIKEQVKLRNTELKSAKSLGVILFSDFEELLGSVASIDLIRQAVNLPKAYHSVRVLLQPYLVGKERQVFGKKYQSLLYKSIPECLNETFDSFALENRINSYSIVYSDMPWCEVEKKVKSNGFSEEPRFALFLKAWNYSPPKSDHKSIKYEEFIETLGKKNSFINRDFP